MSYDYGYDGERDYGYPDEMRHKPIDLTLTVNGLRAFITDMVELSPSTKNVAKIAPNTGRTYTTKEEIPHSERFTLVGVRLEGDDKFVVRLAPHDLNKLNSKYIVESQKAHYENL